MNVAEGLDRVRCPQEKLQEVIDRYNRDPNVEYAEPHIVYKQHFIPNDSYWSDMWGIKKIRANGAWNISTGTLSYSAADIDSGMDMDHPDIVGKLHKWYDYYGGDSNPNDPDGHGTHTGGTIAAHTNNATGVASVSYDCALSVYRAGGYYIYDFAVVKAINAAINNGDVAINMSFGSGSQSQSVKSALTNAYNAGIVNVASAGNDGNTSVNYPAGYSNVIAVASSNSNDNRSGFSSYGSWVDVAAPGENILSTYLNGGYAYADGTSMSAPHVTGMAVILYSQVGSRSKAHADIVRNAIQSTAVNVGSWVKYGRVDLQDAMVSLAPASPPSITGVSPGSVTAFLGGTITITGNDFSGVTQLNSGGTVLTGSDFTIADNNTITYSAPLATSLGLQTVTVANGAGTSNPGYFNYVETNPPAMTGPLLMTSGNSYTWSYGGGANDKRYVLFSADPTTFPYYGDQILLYFSIMQSGFLNAAGTGSLTINLPTGYGTLTVYAQLLTLDENTGAFKDATAPISSYILY
jgi:thermitase